MGIQLRVSLPDQPGALARVAAAIARAGADVISVAVLESEAGRAIDEFRLGWPDGRETGTLVAAIDSCPGVHVLGCRRTRWLIDGRPDLDLLANVLAVPDRGIETLVDMAPAALNADWAELRPPARRLAALYASSPICHNDLAPESMPVRAISGQGPAGAWAYFPIVELHSVLVIGRDDGPAFLRSEVATAERIVEVAMTALDRALRNSPAELLATELSACVAR
jgi:hypothetical protein